jgi:uncharacterized protein (DUF983 family)
MKNLFGVLLIGLAFVGLMNIAELILMFAPWSVLLVLPIVLALILRTFVKGWTNDVSNMR